jgi:hypothetical protein
LLCQLLDYSTVAQGFRVHGFRNSSGSFAMLVAITPRLVPLRDGRKNRHRNGFHAAPFG